MIQEITPGQYIIVTTREKIREQCIGRKEVQFSLTPGVFILSVTTQCSYRTNDWIVEGFKTFSSNITIVHTEIAFVPLNITFSMFTKFHPRSDLLNRPWTKLKDLRAVSLNPIVEPSIDYEQIWKSSSTHNVLLSISLLCSGILGTGILLYLMKKRGWCRSISPTTTITLEAARPICTIPEVAIAYSRFKESTGQREVSASPPDGPINLKDGEVHADTPRTELKQ
jgi:hypothetical protein